jgi:3-methyladenine DNA glycosylase/8-oxoguanine DNA glycosylase
MGFEKNKAKAITNCCKKLVTDYHGNVPDSLEAMFTLSGVGRKTANMALGNAFVQPPSWWRRAFRALVTALDWRMQAKLRERRGIDGANPPQKVDGGRQ